MPEAKLTEDQFLRDVANHQITIIRDDGVNRHIRFKKPDTSDMSFELITWPWHLCYTGDMGTYVFNRIEDMFQFFRSKPGNGEKLYINTGYWAEKCLAADMHGGISEYSAEKATSRIKEWLDDHDASDEIREEVKWQILIHADDGEDVLRQAVDNFEHDDFRFADFFEVNLHIRPFRYIWCCYALSWGIGLYDKYKDRLKQKTAD